MLQLSQPTKLGEVTINVNSTGTAVEIRSAQTPTPSSLDDTTELTPATTAEARPEHHQGRRRGADLERAGVDLDPGHRQRREPLRHRGDHPQGRVLTASYPQAAARSPVPQDVSGGTSSIDYCSAVGSCGGSTGPTRELLAAHVAGDRYAFEELFYRHHRQLYRLAQITSRNPEDAADALQDAMLSAHRSAPAFPPRRGGQQLAVPHRGQRLPGPVAPQQGPPDHRAGGRYLPVGDPTPRVDTAIVVERALMRLPVEQRAAVVAVDMQGYSVAETARMLGVAEGTVKSRCSRARAKLAEALDYFDDGAATAPDHRERRTMTPDGTTAAPWRRLAGVRGQPAGAAMDDGAGRPDGPIADHPRAARRPAGRPAR